MSLQESEISNEYFNILDSRFENRLYARDHNDDDLKNSPKVLGRGKTARTEHGV